MAIILYNFLTPPDFLEIRGQWCSVYDDKCCGWTSSTVPPSADYETLTKQQFLDRVSTIHQEIPYLQGTGEDPTEPRDPFSEQEILVVASNWFDETDK
jgi:hypothetical protein